MGTTLPWTKAPNRHVFDGWMLVAQSIKGPAPSYITLVVCMHPCHWHMFAQLACT